VATSILAAEGDGLWREYQGGVEDYLLQRSRSRPVVATTKLGKKKAEPTPQASVSNPAVAATKSGLSFKERKELEQLPGQIETLEAETDRLQALLADPALYRGAPGEVARLTSELQAKEASHQAAMQRWESLLSRE